MVEVYVASVHWFWNQCTLESWILTQALVCAPTSHISNVIIFSPEFKRIFTISNIHSATKRLHFNLSALAKIWVDVLLSQLFLVSISDNVASWRFVGTGSSLRRRLTESPASASARPYFALRCLALPLPCLVLSCLVHLQWLFLSSRRHTWYLSQPSQLLVV